MEIIKKTEDFTIVKKRSGRYGVKDAHGKWIGANKKIEILLAQGLLKGIKLKAPAPQEEAKAEETQAEAETKAKE